MSSSSRCKARWLILTMQRAFGVFDMCMAVENAGYDYHCADELPLARDELIPDDACVVVNGPAERVAELCRHRRWIPCAWCDPEVFACHTYYRFWHRQLVQEQFVFLPLGSLVAQQSNIFNDLAVQDRVFVRPDSFDKSFDGTLVEQSDFDSWLKRTLAAGAPDTTLCVVARPKVIENEWRVVIRDRRVVAGSSYRIDGRVLKTQQPPSNVVQFAEAIAADPYPGLPNLYVLDVASVGERLAVMEVGSVNACGFYGCDMSVVIREISNEAEKAWQSANDRTE